MQSSINDRQSAQAVIEPGLALDTEPARPWVKMGRLYVPDGELPWAKSHAFPPTPIMLGDATIRIYGAFCDDEMIGRVGWVDVSVQDPSQIIDICDRPVLDIGRPGAFDENGVVPTCVLPVGQKLYMYYVGFQLGHRLRYYQFLGLAISEDGGSTFTRAQSVPVIDRSNEEMVNRTSGFVRFEDGKFRLWYVGGSDWTTSGEKQLPIYKLRYLESDDGMNWGARGRLALDFASEDEHALGRPWVIKTAEGYGMWFSSRTYSSGYRIRYAESRDGISWVRAQGNSIDVSSTGWDSEMVAYAAVVQTGKSEYMFYNGNDCGRTGFGWAQRDSTEKKFDT